MSRSTTNLRQQAEALLTQSETDIATIPSDDLQKLFYEFQVRQLELELQNQELKNIQHELLVSRDHFKHLYASAPIGYMTLSEDGYIQMPNPAAMRLFGASEPELINKKLGQFINSADQDNYHFFLQNILHRRAEQIVTIRLKAMAPNDSVINCQGIKFCNCTPETCTYNKTFRYAEFRGALVDTEHNEKQIILSIYDLTESKKDQEVIACLNEKLEQKIFQQTQDLSETISQMQLNEHQLSEREAKLNAIFDAAVEGIITVDMDGKVVSVNQTVKNIFGFSELEIIGCDITQLIVLNDYQQNADFQLLKFIGKIEEVTGQHKDGNLVPLELSLAQFSLEDRQYLAAIVRDISSRKLQEQREQQHLDELAHVTRMGLMGELASGIAHEVNQPLTAIVNYSQASLNMLQQTDYEKAQLQDILTKTNHQALKAGQIIHRMRDLIKAREIHRSTININNLVTDALELCASYVKQYGINVHLQLIKHLPEICADSVQIEQVILNLIKNSIDALTNVPLSKPRKLSIQTDSNQKTNIEIRIKDNGPGIDDTEQKKIFTPFYTTKRMGMGMGLSICRSIVEAHGGMLRFNSCPPKGTTFYFTLPVRMENNEN